MSPRLYISFLFLMAVSICILYINLMGISSSFLETDRRWRAINFFVTCIKSLGEIYSNLSVRSRTLLMFVCSGSEIVSHINNTMIFRKWVLSITKRQITWSVLQAFHSDFLFMIIWGTFIWYTTAAEQLSFNTLVGWWKTVLVFTKQIGDLQHKSFCWCNQLSVASKISIISWFQKLCCLLILYADSCRSGA